MGTGAREKTPFPQTAFHLRIFSDPLLRSGIAAAVLRAAAAAALRPEASRVITFKDLLKVNVCDVAAFPQNYLLPHLRVLLIF